MRTDDPWYDVLGSGWVDHDDPPAPPRRPRSSRPPSRGRVRQPYDAHAAVYLAVQRSAAFQQVRRRYRRFALPASAAFLAWYLAYVVTATVAPELMARPVAGVFNVAMAAGLAQFASTFLLTWLYVRHARRRRDQLALELRWETQDLARAPMGAAVAAAAAPADAVVPVRAAVPASRTVPEGTR